MAQCKEARIRVTPAPCRRPAASRRQGQCRWPQIGDPLGRWREGSRGTRTPRSSLALKHGAGPVRQAASPGASLPTPLPGSLGCAALPLSSSPRPPIMVHRRTPPLSGGTWRSCGLFTVFNNFHTHCPTYATEQPCVEAGLMLLSLVSRVRKQARGSTGSSETV